MPLHELKLLYVHIVANASEIYADLAPVLFIAGQQLGEGCRALLGKGDALFPDLPVLGFNHIIRLERFDETIDHPLRGDRLLIFLLVASGNGLEQRDNVVENTSPQR